MKFFWRPLLVSCVAAVFVSASWGREAPAQESTPHPLPPTAASHRCSCRCSCREHMNTVSVVPLNAALALKFAELWAVTAQRMIALPEMLVLARTEVVMGRLFDVPATA